MIKHYKSKSTISINAVLKSKKSVHIAFTAQSDGSSVYVTDNTDIQYALEHHYKFGKLFKLVDEEPVSGVADVEQSAQEDASTQESKIIKVKISDFAAAKDYLADTFGISRTSLRSEKAILAAAQEHNIEFEGL